MTTTPTPGEIVLYHHGEDAAWWPAMVLEVTSSIPVQPQTPPTVVIGMETVSLPMAPPTEETLVYLQVFRPRGNLWSRCTEGEGPGQWKVSQ